MSSTQSVTSIDSTDRSGSQYTAYPSYQPSGWHLLDKIPHNWDVIPLKFLSNEPIKSGVGEPGRHTNPDWPRYIRITDVKNPRELHEDTFVSLPPETAAQAPVKSGDLLLASAGSVGDSYLCEENVGEACYAGYLVRVSPSDRVDPRFLSYWTESQVYWTEIRQNVIQTTVQNFSATRYQNLHVPFPPHSQQKLIADFLDDRCGHLDDLIGKKERLIELLEEKRTALITRAVTKGLDPDVPMKDSGVEWLGEIPEHWEVRSPKHLCYVENSGVWGEDSSECDDATPVLRTADIDMSGRVDYDSIESRCLTPAEVSRYRCHKGDILVVKSSGSASNIISGKATLIGPEESGMAFSNFMLRLRPQYSLVIPDFLFRVLTSQLTRERIHRMVSTTTYPNLDVSEYVGFSIPYPSVREQKQVASHLASREKRIWSLQTKVENVIERLREYRSALITAAVTGKIDVRDHAA